MTGPGNSSVLRHEILGIGLPYVLAESGLRLREWIKRPENDGRIRTIFAPLDCAGVEDSFSQFRGAGACLRLWAIQAGCSRVSKECLQ